MELKFSLLLQAFHLELEESLLVLPGLLELVPSLLFQHLLLLEVGFCLHFSGFLGFLDRFELFSEVMVFKFLEFDLSAFLPLELLNDSLVALQDLLLTVLVRGFRFGRPLLIDPFKVLGLVIGALPPRHHGIHLEVVLERSQAVVACVLQTLSLEANHLVQLARERTENGILARMELVFAWLVVVRQGQVSLAVESERLSSVIIHKPLAPLVLLLVGLHDEAASLFVGTHEHIVVKVCAELELELVRPLSRVFICILVDPAPAFVFAVTVLALVLELLDSLVVFLAALDGFPGNFAGLFVLEGRCKVLGMDPLGLPELSVVGL